MKLPRITLVAAHDIFMAVAAFEIAVWLRYLTYGAPQSLGVVWEGTVVFAVVSAIVFWTVGLYRGIWYYASLNDLLAIAKAVTNSGPANSSATASASGSRTIEVAIAAVALR